ncbi:hypothetical protein CF327_g6542 [Tilletia walkeri]|nr:hypothetical protein CF327_g6542 [Tilletia walkeri]
MPNAEVPIGYVFVREGRVIAAARNRTNELLNVSGNSFPYSLQSAIAMKLFIPLFFAATLALVNIASGQAIVENPKAVFCSAKCLKFMDKVSLRPAYKLTHMRLNPNYVLEWQPFFASNLSNHHAARQADGIQAGLQKLSKSILRVVH